MSPDERSIASWIKKALENRAEKEWKKVQEGIFVSGTDLISLVRELKNACNFELYLLHPRGEDMRKTEISPNPCFILGDHIGLPQELEEEIERMGARKISIGPKEYLASTCIAVVNNELDRRGME